MTKHITECFDLLESITEANKRVVDKNIKLKEKITRQNGQKDLLYNQKKWAKKMEHA